MLVTLVADRENEGRVIAFIDNCIAFFPMNEPPPGIPGNTLEIMITGVQHTRVTDATGNHYYDELRPKSFFIRKIEADDVLVEHQGFDCARLSAGILARANVAGRRLNLSPGSTTVYSTDNRFPERAVEALHPGKVWIRMPTNSRKNVVRVEGLNTNTDCKYYVIRKQKQDEEEKGFIFYWLDGKYEFLHGSKVETAFSSKYGPGALAAVDFYEEAKEPTYKWDATNRNWVKEEVTA